MKFYEKVSNLANEKGIPISRLEDDLNIGRGSLSHLKATGGVSSGKNILKIADYFGLSVETLMREVEI